MTTTTLTPAAAHFTRLGRFINDEDLPDASISVHDDGRIVTVDGTRNDLPENTVRRWAAALGAVVREKPHEMPDGTAATYFTADALRDGIHFHVYAFVAIKVAA